MLIIVKFGGDVRKMSEFSKKMTDGNTLQSEKEAMDWVKDGCNGTRYLIAQGEDDCDNFRRAFEFSCEVKVQRF